MSDISQRLCGFVKLLFVNEVSEKMSADILNLQISAEMRKFGTNVTLHTNVRKNITLKLNEIKEKCYKDLENRNNTFWSKTVTCSLVTRIN